MADFYRLMKGIRWIESGWFPEWSHPWVMAVALRRWPRKVKEDTHD